MIGFTLPDRPAVATPETRPADAGSNVPSPALDSGCIQLKNNGLGNPFLEASGEGFDPKKVQKSI
jgi:hypothetical protein